MSLITEAYVPAFEDEWEQWCQSAVNSTFQHTRKFLSYHEDRFKDRSVLVRDEGKLVAVFPAAQAPSDAGTVVSHPGATYGGLVHQGGLSGSRAIAALESLKIFFKDQGYKKLLYKAVPETYCSVPSQDDRYALFRLGAERVRTDLSSSIALNNRRPPSSRRKRNLKKALKVVQLVSESDRLAQVWQVVADNLAREHSTVPVHSLDELKKLQGFFPDQITVRAAMVNGKVEAGVILFNGPLVWHAQYIAASETAYECSALDAVFDLAIADATSAGARYFDFGTSNEEAGTVLNDGLYQYKAEFGGGGVAHDYFNLDLET